jgi:hypothetical protein
MGLAGASAGAISGVIVDAWGYSALTLLAALAPAPLIVLAAFSTSRIDDRGRPGEVSHRQRSARTEAVQKLIREETRP